MTVAYTWRIDGLQTLKELESFLELRWIAAPENKSHPPFSALWPFADPPNEWPPGYEKEINRTPKPK